MSQSLGLRWFVIALSMGLCIWAIIAFAPINYGVDIRGGTILTYKVEELAGADLQATPGQPKKAPVAKDQLVETVTVIADRINKEGLKDIQVRSEGTDQISITIAGANKEQTGPIRERMTQVGQLLMPFVANEGDQAPAGMIFKRQEFDQKRADMLKAHFADPTKPKFDAPSCFKWFPNRPQRREKETLEGYKARVAEYEEKLKKEPWTVEGEWFYFIPKFWDASVDPLATGFGGKDIQNGSVRPSTDDRGGAAVAFDIKPDSQAAFAAYTKEGFAGGRSMSLILNEEVWNVARIQGVLREGVRITSGGAGFTEDEQRWLLRCLQSGSLKLKPRLIAQEEISATLGGVAVGRGITAFVIGLALVIGFMLTYYRTSGILAIIALICNVVMTFGIMATLDAAWTLPGIAGLVLTLGMAVDGNILVNERIREELLKGKSLPQAAKIGYDRAFLVIFDANLTTFLTAAALAWYGTGPVRGFGYTLMVGIVTTVFTSVYFTRTFLGQLIRSGVVKDLKFGRMFEPHYKFMAKAKGWTMASIAVIAVTMGTFFVVGDEKYGIDFNGGTAVRVHFNEGVDASWVKKQVAAIKGENGEQKYRQVEANAFDAKSGKAELFDLTLDYVSTTNAATDDATQGQDEYLTIERELESAFSGKLIAKPLTVVAFDPTQSRWSATLTLLQAHDDANALKTAAERAGMVNATVTKSDQAGLAWSFAGTVNADLQKTFGSSLLTSIEATVGNVEISKPFPRVRFLGPNVVSNLKSSAFQSMILSLIAITLYVWFRFKELKYGLAATIALVHDVLVALGVSTVATKLGLVDAHITLNAVAAYLTIVGFSINDTIVNFDRIRENLQTSRLSLSDIVDKSMNQTLARSIFTSMTVFLTTLAIWLCNIGIESPLEGLGFTLTIGVVAGSYSSIFIASPIVVWLTNWEERRKAKIGRSVQPAVKA